MVRQLVLSVVAAAAVILGANAQLGDNTTTTVAPPVRNVWNVTKDGITCILFDANVTVAVKFPIQDPAHNTTTRSDYVDVIVPSLGATVGPDSTCNMVDEHFNITAQLLRVTFYPDGSAQPWNVFFYFTNDTKTNSGKAFGLYRIELHAVYDGVHFNTSTLHAENFTSINNIHSYSDIVGANAEHSSKCSTGVLKITDNAKVVLDTFQVQAFGTKDTFFEPELCNHDSRTSDIVPIVVGACLAGLVIAVLIAYLIGRARAKRQGYASV